MNEQAKLIERLTRHQIFIQRFGGGQVKKGEPIIRDLARDVRRRIAEGNPTEFQLGRLQTLQEDIETLAVEASRGIQGELDLRDFAVQEMEFTERLLGRSVNVDLATGINPDRLEQAFTRRRMTLTSGRSTKRLTITEAFDQLSSRMGRDAMNQVQLGLAEGKTQGQMAREVSQLIRDRSRQQMEAVIRTATNHTGAVARDELYRENADILKGERVVATLDGRTTLFCMGEDGRIYDLGEGPQFPAHFGCRTLRVPEVRDEFRIQAKGERASMDGPVSNQKTYGGFLRDQSKEFQDDVLGPERAKLFRSGEVSINRFTDDAGRVLTLDELRDREGITLQ